MRILINDFEEEMEDGATVAEAIERWEEHDVNLVVELNHRFVHRDRYCSTPLKEGDRLELINPAFGG
jgi:thiamine biosynthesis protein ThiS